MIQLNRFSKNPFNDAEISLNELCAGATETLQRMVTHNPGGFLTSSITGLTAAMANCDLAINDDGIKLGLRKGRKQAKDTFRENLPAAMTKVHAGVVAKYGPDAPEVAECFPHGRSVFKDCRDDRLENEIGIVWEAISGKVAALGATLVGEAAGLLSTWLALYAASELSSGAKKATQLTQKGARDALADELFKVLLTVARQTLEPGEQPQIDDYFVQSLFSAPSPEEEEEEPPAPPVP